MTSLPLGLVAEIVVAALLVVTIAFCFRLNRRLGRLHSAEAMMRANVADLLSATEVAERAIHDLKASARDSDAILRERIGAAGTAAEQLGTEIEAAERLMKRVGAIARAPGSAAVPGTPAEMSRSGTGDLRRAAAAVARRLDALPSRRDALKDAAA